jgi:glycosyltransferase involved in cell wall biosynthesis
VITVITPTIEGREDAVAEAAASVQAQAIPAYQHLIRADTKRRGPASARNDCLAMTETPLVAFLDDDDVLYPNHLAVLVEHMDDADLVFSWHDGGPGVPRFESWDASAYWTMMQGSNVIPVTVLAKLDSIREAGAFRSEDRYED